MGKPRLIILIRHAQSEGNANKTIHQTIPDHRVKLTPEGKKQAVEAGRKLRSLLKPSDTLHFFTSPYRRTRETTEGILESLTCDDPTPSPFPRHKIKVYEEPRLREQDFGNFQPSSQEMSRMWQERADYGHFFYRIPNGESAADAYDRVSGFNESLWRSFGEEDFASVCVLVTHGLMTRVFLMKWYHFSVEYFEDLRNMNHCEFVVMRKSIETGKYILRNQLRTWSAMKREKELVLAESPPPMRKKWGGCPNGYEEHRKDLGRNGVKRQNTIDLFKEDGTTSVGLLELALGKSLREITGIVAHHSTDASQEDEARSEAAPPSLDTKKAQESPQIGVQPASTVSETHRSPVLSPDQLNQLLISTGGRDGGGSRSGAASCSDSSTSESAETEKEDTDAKREKKKNGTKSRDPHSIGLALDCALNRHVGEIDGMGSGVMADALGDQSDADDDRNVNETLAAFDRVEIEGKSFEGSVR